MNELGMNLLIFVTKDQIKYKFSDSIFNLNAWYPRLGAPYCVPSLSHK